MSAPPRDVAPGATDTTRVNDRPAAMTRVTLPSGCRIRLDLPLRPMCPYRGPGSHRRGPLARPGGSLRCPTPRSIPSPPTSRPGPPPAAQPAVVPGPERSRGSRRRERDQRLRPRPARRPGRRARPPARQRRRRGPRRRRVPAVRHRRVPGPEHRTPSAAELRRRARPVQHRVRVRQRAGRHRAARRGRRSSEQTARAIGDGLVYAQEHDPGYSDGRLRQGYNVGPYTFYDGNPQPYGFVLPDGTANIGWQFGFLGTAVGDMAWPGIALAQLFARTATAATSTPRSGSAPGSPRTRGPPSRWAASRSGSTARTAGAERLDRAQHRLRRVLRHPARAHARRAWSKAADHARGVRRPHVGPGGGAFWTGTNDGVEINRFPVPLDTADLELAGAAGEAVRRRARLGRVGPRRDRRRERPDVPAARRRTALRASRSAPRASRRPRSTTASPCTRRASGSRAPTSSRPPCSTGTAGRQARPRTRCSTRPGTRRTCSASASTWAASRSTAGSSRPPASWTPGFGFGYFQVQHVGATSWFVFGETRTNPYRLRGRS